MRAYISDVVCVFLEAIHHSVSSFINFQNFFNWKTVTRQTERERDCLSCGLFTYRNEDVVQVSATNVNVKVFLIKPKKTML